MVTVFRISTLDGLIIEDDRTRFVLKSHVNAVHVDDTLHISFTSHDKDLLSYVVDVHPGGCHVDDDGTIIIPFIAKETKHMLSHTEFTSMYTIVPKNRAAQDILIRILNE